MFSLESIQCALINDQRSDYRPAIMSALVEIVVQQQAQIDRLLGIAEKHTMLIDAIATTLHPADPEVSI